MDGGERPPNGVPQDRPGDGSDPSIRADGRVVAYAAEAGNVTPMREGIPSGPRQRNVYTDDRLP